MGWFFKGLPPAKGLSPLYPMEIPNGAANTVGDRFIPSGFTPQGRFRHQPEQVVHPPFAWQAPTVLMLLGLALSNGVLLAYEIYFF